MIKYSIPVTEYMRPDGFMYRRQIEVSPYTYLRALVLMYESLRFEMETLHSGRVSLTIFDPVTETDLDICVGPANNVGLRFSNMIIRLVEGR